MSFAPRTRVEVYIPVRYETAYQDVLTWAIEEFTHLHGGCTVLENVGGYYRSETHRLVSDRISVVYCDLPMNWEKRGDRNAVREYCADLQSFLLRNFWEEAVLIVAYPTSHIAT